MKILRDNVRRLRLMRGLTQQELAERAEMDCNYFQKIESGRWGGLRLTTVETLARALDVAVWELFVPRKETAGAESTARRDKPGGGSSSGGGSGGGGGGGAGVAREDAPGPGRGRH
ncbi:MAG: helix-turn-helix domain-containing protein [Opitutaceae bacterium]|nr:helix-turn-helix domain-containing protein [Opitutaceae bacterium]